MSLIWRIWLARIIGASFILSGTAKILGVGEDTEAVLSAMALANANTELEALSNWLATYHRGAVLGVAIIMLATGVAQVFRTPFAKAACIMQLAMIICFVTLLHRAFPAIFLDGFYVMALVPLLLEPESHRATPA